MRKYLNAARTQTAYLLFSKGAMITFALLLALVLMNFIGNVTEFRGYDRVEMYHPMKMLLLSYNRTCYNADLALVLIQLVPLVICLPAGLSLVTEQQNGEAVLAVSRLGARTYIWSKLTAAFAATLTVFSVPFLIEIALNCLAFPLDATGDFTNWEPYSQDMLNGVKEYTLPGLYALSPYLYAVVCTVLFGAFAGLLSALTIAISALWRVKYKAILILPVFLLLEATLFIGRGTGWYNYVLLFNDQHRARQTAWLLVLLAAAFIAFGAERFARKDKL